MLISRAGDAFTTVALSWVVLTLAGPVQLGIVLACFGLPRVVSGPIPAICWTAGIHACSWPRTTRPEGS